MAKRKRLSVPSGEAVSPTQAARPAPQERALTGNAMISDPNPLSPPAAPRRAPIADVAGQAAATSALETLAGEMAAMKADGRLIQSLKLSSIQLNYLVRDRLTVDPEELEVLKTSLLARGQQTPIEVVDKGDGSYGLISGFRRTQALLDLQASGQGGDTVLALIRTPDTASDAYTAMVEENEIRVGLSYMDRASVVIAACDQGVFPSRDHALRDLFASASRTKRSKIKSFLIVADKLGAMLRFPEAVTERQGLALGQVLEVMPDFARGLQAHLRTAPPETPAAEQVLITRALARAQAELSGAAKPKVDDYKPRTIKDVLPGVSVKIAKGQIQLSGDGATLELAAAVVKFLKSRET